MTDKQNPPVNKQPSETGPGAKEGGVNPMGRTNPRDKGDGNAPHHGQGGPDRPGKDR